jgi:hypothetical protein
VNYMSSDGLQELTYNVTQIQIASFTVFVERKKRSPTDEANKIPILRLSQCGTHICVFSLCLSPQAKYLRHNRFVGDGKTRKAHSAIGKLRHRPDLHRASLAGMDLIPTSPFVPAFISPLFTVDLASAARTWQGHMAPHAAPKSGHAAR